MASARVHSTPLCLFVPVIAIVFLAAVLSRTSLVAPASSVSVVFPAGSAWVLDDSVRIDVQTALRRLPKVSDVACGTSGNGEAKMMVIFQSGTDPNVATSSV